MKHNFAFCCAAAIAAGCFADNVKEEIDLQTADWNADSCNRWFVPLGVGDGKIMRWGKLPLNRNAQVYCNAEKPTGCGDDTARIQLLFPK